MAERKQQTYCQSMRSANGIQSFFFIALMFFGTYLHAEEYALLHSATKLGATDLSWDFDAVDWNRDGHLDLVGISRKGGSGRTEVHVLDGASGYQTFLLQDTTALGITDASWSFTVFDWNLDNVPDIVCIFRKGSSNSTEVHILNGATKFQSYLLQTKTALGISDDSYQFKMIDWNRDGKGDLVAVLRKGSSSRTEVHVLSGASDFSEYILHSETKLNHTDNNWTFGFAIANDGDNVPDLVALKKQATGTSSTEIHILSSRTNYQEYFLQMGTLLHETDGNWSVSLCDWNHDAVVDICSIVRKGNSALTELHIFPAVDKNGYAMRGASFAIRTTETTTKHTVKVEASIPGIFKVEVSREVSTTERETLKEPKGGRKTDNKSTPSPGPPPKPLGPRH